MSGCNILSLDGGGCRGVVSAVLVAKLAEDVAGFVPGIDLFAGTSIGAANAMSLAQGHPPGQMPRFYAEHGRSLFSRPFKPTGLRGRIARALERVPLLGAGVRKGAQLFWPKWSTEGLQVAIEGYFGSATTLGRLTNRVMLTTMALDGRLTDYDVQVVLPKVMHNYPGSPDLELDIHTALLRSMSAPTYFPSTRDGYVDGGVFASNPSMAALATAVSEMPCRLEDVRMLSVGVGISRDGIRTRGQLDWGLLKWGEHLADVTGRAQAEFDGGVCRVLLGDHYCRLNVVLPPGRFPMDDYRTIPALTEIAERATESAQFRKARTFVRTHFG